MSKVRIKALQSDGKGGTYYLCDMEDKTQWTCDLEGKNWKKVGLSEEELTKLFNSKDE